MVRPEVQRLRFQIPEKDPDGTQLERLEDALRSTTHPATEREGMIKPTRSKVLLREYREWVSPGGIVLVDDDQGWKLGLQRAEVMAVGDDVEDVSVGDRVLFKAKLAKRVSLDDFPADETYFLEEEQIIGVLL